MNNPLDILKGLIADEDAVAERAKRVIVLHEDLQQGNINKDEYVELMTDLTRIDEAVAQTLDLRRINALNDAISLLKTLSSLAK